MDTIRADILTSIFTLMTSDVPLSDSVGGRIYDHVPQDTEYPYIAIDTLNVQNIDSHTNKSVDGDVTLHVWSRYSGTKEANEIIDLIDTVLGDVDLGIIDVCTINFKRSFSDTSKDPDGKTIHGVTKYDFILGG